MELVIKLIGLGPKKYAQDSFNIFDAIIVLFSVLDWVLLRVADAEDAVRFGGTL